MKAAKELKTIRAARRDPNAFIDYLELPDPLRKDESLKQSACHIKTQNFLSKNNMAIVQLPRNHGKTTQVRLRIIWEIGRNPQVRITYICQNDRQAIKRVNGIRKLVSGPLGARIRRVFPNLCIDTNMPHRESEFTVRRTGDLIDPTLCSMGITGSGTGNRADLIILDDVVDPKNSGTEGERDKIFERITDDILQFMEVDDNCWAICTPWHEDDANARIVKLAREEGEWKALHLAIDDDFVPVWPERRDKRWLKKKERQIGKRAFSQGYHLKVVSDSDRVFDKLTYFDYADRKRLQDDERTRIPTRAYIAVDPAFTKKTYSDHTGLVAGEIGASPDIFITRAKKMKVEDSELIRAVADFADECGTKIIFIEQAGQGQRLLLSGVREEGVRRHHEAYIVIGVKPQRAGAAWTDKRQRASQLSRFFADGTARIAGRKANGGWEPTEWTKELVRQMTFFTGISESEDDLVDAVVYLVYSLTTQLWTRHREADKKVNVQAMSPKERFVYESKREHDRPKDDSLIPGKIWGWQGN